MANQVKEEEKKVEPIKFDADNAKKTTQQVMEVEAGDVAGQEIYSERQFIVAFKWET